MIIAALWYGPNLPDMDIALQPVLKVISELNRDGVSVNQQYFYDLNYFALYLTFQVCLKQPKQNSLMANMAAFIAMTKEKYYMELGYINQKLNTNYKTVPK